MWQKHFKKFIFIFCALISIASFSQDTIRVGAGIDSLYREDQFYIGITYNLISSAPSGVRIRGLSGGIQGGFTRDMPINKRRNVAIAVGAGLAFDQFGQNLFIGESAMDNTIFRVLNEDEIDFSRNRFTMAIVEAPIQFRWRTSTSTESNFWRIYAGFRVGYAFYYRSTFKQPNNNVNQTKIPEFDPLRLSATLSFGFSTFNFYGSYSINPFFKDAFTVNGEAVDFRTIKIGLMFYIL
ncbi:porin family protein [Aequorivita echinoideorum]|uniref:PorT family protein n=1 Tax=Aequorivita echinoideorum TaxID=1549647 RepID=A0ABS5S3K4_9FLAO|nr:porin family protein [Aequorivita echinoideorum]MBT0607791.1 PorT family protein [Aequorivita echinoideorum]